MTMTRTTLIAALLASVSMTVLADDHIRRVPYSPMKRTDVMGIVGQPTTITFPKGESVYRVVQSERVEDGEAAWRGPKPEEAKDVPIGRNLPLWPVRAGTTVMTVLTITPDGDQKSYPLRLIVPAGADGADTEGATYNLIFDGTAAGASMDPVQKAAAAKAWFAKKSAAEAETKARIAEEAFNDPTASCHFEAHGPRPSPIEPRCPMDNGQWTVFRFPGLSQKPAIYIVTGKDEERLARQHEGGNFVVVEEIAEHFRLRLGAAVLDINNRAFDPVGRPANTGTTNPALVREVIQAVPHG